VIVSVPGRPYAVVAGHGALAELGRTVKELGAPAAAVVSDSNVAAAWAEPALASLTGAGVRAELYSVQPGERAKSLDELGRVLTFLEEVRLDRHGAVVALGGGTVGDLAGFAAAVWLRGVRAVQVPTTLLAMVDSSVGGKTGVNTARTKNSVGAFWQPSAVVADLATLTTLPEDEYLAAFAEIVKYGVAMDAGLAGQLARLKQQLLSRQPEALETVVTRCVELKAQVVAADERETGPRQVLNYGHTVGHAVEAVSRYQASHGRAVAQGMRAAVRIAERMGLCDARLVSTQEDLLTAFGLPGRLPQVDPEDVLSAISRDKKSRAGAVRWVLPRELGRVQVGVQAPQELVADVVRALLA
jgi:3-dehydroquinate synthase